MSRKRIFNINNFSGGITDDIRNTTDLSKCAYVSHFDIYRDPHKLYPMPGYIDDMNDGSTATGMKSYSVKDFLAVQGGVWAVGTKSDGSGWKLFQKTAIDDAAWDTTPTGTPEGTYTLYPKTFLLGDSSNQFFVTTNASKTWMSWNNGGAVTENYNELLSSALATVSRRTVGELALDGNYYTNKANTNLVKISSATVTDDIFSTGMRVNDVVSGDESLGIFGYRYSPHFAQLMIWDLSSTLADQNVNFGKGMGTAIGYISGTWVGVVDENLTSIDNLGFDDEANGKHSLAIKYATGTTAETLLRLYGKTSTNAYLWPNRSMYRDCMLFEARIPTDANGTTFRGGVWAIGRSPQGGIAVSQLLDTETLGSVQRAYFMGSHCLLAHGGDGSISRLDDFTSGTYDITAVYESLMFGADTPNYKKLKGISVMTEDLPASATVVVKYRFDEDDSWTSLGTSSTDGDEIHNFTGTIGNFQEIQFRVEVLGNAPIKNIYVALEELDTTPYDS